MLKGSNLLDERVPKEVGTIQVNFCKNPQCKNFGIPASTIRQPRGRGAAKRGRDTYTVVGSGRGTPIRMGSGLHNGINQRWSNKKMPLCKPDPIH